MILDFKKIREEHLLRIIEIENPNLMLNANLPY